MALLGLGVHGTLVPEELFFSSKAVAALTTAGGVVTWGDSNSGGDSSNVASQLESGVKTVHPGRHVFAALKHDGSLVVWGCDTYGGTPHTTNGVPAAALASGVTKVVSGCDYFAALKDDGTVACVAAVVVSLFDTDVLANLPAALLPFRQLADERCVHRAILRQMNLETLVSTCKNVEWGLFHLRL